MATNESPGAEQGNFVTKTAETTRKRSGEYSSESDKTTSSEDEVISNVSLHQGLNPCKCCVGEDCDLRRHCIAIGFIEITFWIFFIMVTVLAGLITRGSEAVIYQDTATMPSFKRIPKNMTTRKSGGGGAAGKTTVPPYRNLITLPPIIVGDKDIGSLEGPGGSEDVEHTTRFEDLLFAEYGEAARILKPDTKQGMSDWKKNLDKYLVVIVFMFVVTVVLSIMSGCACVLGSFHKKVGLLRLHILLSMVTAGSTVCLGILTALLHGFTQLLLCIIFAGFYLYFAFCTHGMITSIHAGVFDDFEFQGMTYTYSTILRAEVRKNSVVGRRDGGGGGQGQRTKKPRSDQRPP